MPAPLGDFCLIERIAEGGMAEVFLARRYDSGPELYAVKRLHPHLADRQAFVEMFESEGRVASLLRHANIVRTDGLGRVGRSPYIVMEYLSGRELRDVGRYLAERESRLPVPVVLWLVQQMLAALDHAHAACDGRGQPLDLVNRDISPTNVLLTYAGEVKLIDFGIAQSRVGFTTQIGQIKGKIAYMSPEQVRGLSVDRRSDVFSVGIVLHELLTGRRLFTGESDFSLMEAVRAAPIPPPSTRNPLVEPELDAIVGRALARTVSERWPDAAEFGAALRHYWLARGLDYSPQELAGWLAAAFPVQRRLELERLRRARELPLPPRQPDETGPAARAATLPPAGVETGPGAPARFASWRRHGPVLLGILVGLLISALIYWVVLS